jgi:hypothetical protein
VLNVREVDMAHISGSVGANGKNMKTDVETVQKLLNRVPPDKGGPGTPLKVDGLCWQKTTGAIERFQKTGCGFKWPDRLVSPGKRTWIELDKYDQPAAPPPAAEEPKCGRYQPELASSLAPGGTTKSFFVGKYLPVPLDAWQRTIAQSVFGTSLDLDAILVVYRKPPGAKGMCIGGPLPGQSTLILGSSVKELLIHELTHVWQSQHHSVAGKCMWNSMESQKLADARDESAYWYIPNKPFGQYAAEQIADQVENGEPPIVAHIRSRAVRFHDPFNIESLKTPRSQARDPKVAKHAVANY